MIVQGRNVDPSLAIVLVYLDYLDVSGEIEDTSGKDRAITLSYRDYPSAAKAFQKVLAKRPTDLDALIGLGVAQRGERKVEDGKGLTIAATRADRDDLVAVVQVDALDGDRPVNT